MPLVKHTFVAFFFVAVLFFVCPLYAKAPSYPLWFTDEGLEEIFPQSQYIREHGEGKTKHAAENDAVSYIARYFETEVSVSSVTSINAVQSNKQTKITETTDIQNAINSNIKLFAIKYTESFYEKKAKTYHVVAYIDRKDAWNQYASTIQVSRDEFIDFYERAKNSEDAIQRIRLYTSALDSGNSFNEKLTFANAISEKLTKQKYAQDRQILSALPSIIRDEQISNAVYIQINHDFSGIVENALRAALTDVGFALTKTRTQAAYIADVDVNYNSSQNGTSFVMNPELRFSLEGKKGSVYTFNTETERVLAPSVESAEKLSAKDLAQKIQETLAPDMKNSLGL